MSVSVYCWGACLLFGQFAFARLACAKGVHRSVAIAYWLTQMLKEHGVTAHVFFPSLHENWGKCLENAIEFVTQQT